MVKKSESRLEIRDELITDNIHNSSGNQIFDGTNITTNIGTVDGVDVAELKDISDYADSPMVVSGGEITEGTNAGTFKVAALTALLRTSNSSIGELDYVTLAEQDNQSIALADTLYYISLNYNGGSPTITLSTSSPYSADKRNIPIGQVMKDSSDNVHYITGGFRFQDGVQKLHSRAKTLRNLELSYGSTIAYSGTNNFTMTDGILYGGINRFALSSYDSAVTAFTYIYSDGAGGWTEVDSNTIDYNHYDDGDGVLGTIGVGRYSCHWVYRHVDDGHVYVVYGVGNYKLAEAEVAPEPSTPDYITNFGTLIGCIIAPQTGGSFTEVQMVTDTFFTGTAVATHNDLGGLQGGTSDEYYHLTQDDYNLINAITVSSTEINYLTGLTQNISTSLNEKLDLSGGTMTGGLYVGTNEIGHSAGHGMTFDASGNATFDGDITVENDEPYVVLKDSDSTTGTDYKGYYSFQLANGSEIGLIGYSSGLDSALRISNTAGGFQMYCSGNREMILEDTYCKFTDEVRFENDDNFKVYKSTYPYYQFDTGDWWRLNSDVHEWGIGGTVEMKLGQYGLYLQDNNIYDVTYIYGAGNLTFIPDVSTYTGYLKYKTGNTAGNAWLNRITVLGGADVVEINITNAVLDLNECDIKNVGDVATETMTVEDTSGNSKFQIVYNSTDGTLDFNYVGA